jgi:tetratricopeptide (TPR) repeat protein
VNRGSNNRPTSIKPRVNRLAAGIALLTLAACAAPLAIIPVTPLLASALATHSGDLETRKRIAELQSRGEWPSLEQMATAQLAASPGSEDALVLLAYSRLQLRKYEAAQEPLLQMTRLHPEEIDGWNLLGETQRLLGRHDQALRTLVHATSIDPSSPVSRFLIGETYRSQGRPDLALAAYQQAVELDSGMALAWYGLGLCLKSMGQQDELAKAMQVLQKLDPGMAAQLAKQN